MKKLIVIFGKSLVFGFIAFKETLLGVVAAAEDVYCGETTVKIKDKNVFFYCLAYCDNQHVMIFRASALNAWLDSVNVFLG